jgi:hypothetical protein
VWFDLVLIGLSVVQLTMLAIAAWQIRRLRRERVDQADATSGVPALLIISTLNKIDHRMDGLEEQLQHLIEQLEQRRGTSQSAAPAAMAISTAHDVPIANNYELAQQLAREGGDLDTLMQRCKLSRNEAELVLRLYSGRG